MEYHSPPMKTELPCHPSPRKRMFQLLARVVGKTPCRWLGQVGEFPISIVFCYLGGSMNWSLGHGAWVFPSKGGWNRGWNWPQKLQCNRCNPTTLATQSLQPRKCTPTQNVLAHALQVNLWIQIQRFSPRHRMDWMVQIVGAVAMDSRHKQVVVRSWDAFFFVKVSCPFAR